MFLAFILRMREFVGRSRCWRREESNTLRAFWGAFVTRVNGPWQTSLYVLENY